MIPLPHKEKPVKPHRIEPYHTANIQLSTWKNSIQWPMTCLLEEVPFLADKFSFLFFIFPLKKYNTHLCKAWELQKKCILNTVSLSFLSARHKHNISVFSQVQTQWTPGLLAHHSQRKLQYIAVQTLAWSFVSLSRLTWMTACDLNTNFYTLTSLVLMLHCPYNLSICSQLSRCWGHFLFSSRQRRQVCKQAIVIYVHSDFEIKNIYHPKLFTQNICISSFGMKCPCWTQMNRTTERRMY